MNRFVRRMVTSAAVLAAATTALVVTPGTAEAATYNGACGPGYSILQGYPVWGGSIYLLYNGSTDCVVTVRDNPGAYYYMNASVGVSGGDLHVDAGNYTTYAGPVYAYAPGECINWGGGINNDIIIFQHVHCG